MAKAQEMLKDPVYMEAARKKVNELQAKAQQRGLIDRNGQPVAGAAAAAAQQMGVEGLAELGAAAAYPNVKAPGQGGGSPGMEAATRDPREWELENIERMKQGELNHAELGFANMKAAINDPGMMKNVMEMMKDPATMAEVRRARARNSAARNSAARDAARNSLSLSAAPALALSQVKKLMSDPTFKAQAQGMAAKLQSEGGMPDISQMAGAMGGMGGMGGGGGGGPGLKDELARLRAENARLKQGLKREL